MESSDNKRKKYKHSEDDNYQDKRFKKPRSRSKSPKRRRYWEFEAGRKRRHSKSQSPVRHIKRESAGKENEPTKISEPKSDIPERKAKETDMLNTRTGGAYIPPARLRMMQAQITDKSSVAYQRLAWEALKKSIHGHINKINVGNIGIIIKELLKENIVRGRGLLCRSVIQAQAASPTFTNVYAALVAAVNSRFPNIGELLLKRLVIQFKRGFKRNDKPTCISSASFIAHLVNQRVAHEILALELLTLLVETPTDDSVEVAIAFLKECGQKLTEVSSKGVNAIFEMLRNILHEGQLDKRVQYMIEVMFQVWKDGFKDHPALIEELELVPEEEQFTHLLMLDDATDPQDILNVFKFDDKYEENEQKYKTLSKEILGSDADSGEDGSGESGSDESDEEEEENDELKGGVTIIDNTETNLIALRRTIYLTINSSLDFEECAHKLMKMQLKPGQEVELCHMFLDCCAEQRTYEKFYGLLAQRFCNINRMYIGPFEEIFKDSYGTAHRLDTNRLRNVSKFFAHLLFTDSISWEVLECVKLNEEDTTSSSRIYIKILFQELAEYMGLKKLNDRLKDPTLQDAFSGIFPRDNPKNTRFSINFFTSIGLGGLTDELREHLKQMPKNVPAPVQEILVDSESDSSSSSSSSDSSSDSSSSESENDKEKKTKSKDKSKEKPPQTAMKTVEKDKNVERWDHSGFYDTYGKDARRHENPNTQERGTFVAPRDKNKRRDNEGDRHRERDYEERDSRSRRRQKDSRNDSYDTRDRNDRRRHEDRNEPVEEENRNREERENRRYDQDKDRRYIVNTNKDKYYRQSDKDGRGKRDNVENEYKSRNKPNEDQEDRFHRKSDNESRKKRNNDDEYKYSRDNKRQGDRENRSGEERGDRSKYGREERRQAQSDDENSLKQKTSTEVRKDAERNVYSDEEESRHKVDKQKKSYQSSSKRDKKISDEYSSAEEENSRRKCDTNKKNGKDVIRKNLTDDSDNSDDEGNSKKKKKRKKKKSKHDSSEEDSNRREEKQYYDTDKKTRKQKSKRDSKKVSDDGWDIRGNSIRRDLGERYWN